MSSKNEVPWQARQGDVLVEHKEKPLGAKALKAMTEIPREDGGVVLAHGEVTGHKHQLRAPGICQLRNEATGERFLVVGSDGEIVHEEHVPPIRVEAGQYEVTQQCQWNWTQQRAEQAYD